MDVTARSTLVGYTRSARLAPLSGRSYPTRQEHGEAMLSLLEDAEDQFQLEEHRALRPITAPNRRQISSGCGPGHYFGDGQGLLVRFLSDDPP